MTQFLRILLAAAFITFPVSQGFASEAQLPQVMTAALHDAAATGDPLIVDAVTDRFGTLFPGSKTELQSYMTGVVLPATHLASIVQQITLSQPVALDPIFGFENSSESPEVNALAADLNSLDVGTTSAIAIK